MYSLIKNENTSLEEIFRVAFEYNAAATAIFNYDTTIAVVNDAYCKMSGYSREEVVGMSWIDQIPPDELPRLKEYNQRRLAGQESAPSHYEFKFLTKHKEIKYGYMSIASLPEYKLLVLSFTDITEEKKKEQLIKTQSEALKELLEKRDNDLVIAVSKLIANNESNKSILSDLREILRSAEDDSGDIIEKVKGMIEKISNQKNIDSVEKFRKNFNIIYPDFISKILQHHPKLTPAEIRLSALLCLNMHSKEIASTLNISYHSVRIARERLRKRLNLENETNLTTYLMSFK